MLSKPSWNSYDSRFIEVLSALCPDPILCGRLYKIFNSVAANWMTSCIKKERPFKSGITIRSSPVEISIAFSPQGNPVWRFLAQPGIQRKSALQTLDYSREICLSLVEQICGYAPYKNVAQLIDDLLPLICPKFEPKFIFLIGAQVGDGLPCTLKLYFNAWLFSNSVGTAIARILHTAGIDPICLRTLWHLNQHLPLGRYFINGIGIDVTGDYISPKVYLVLPSFGLRDMDMGIQNIISDRMALVLREILQRSNKQGQLHMSLRFPRSEKQSSIITVFPMATDFFSSDIEAMDVAEDACQPTGKVKSILTNLRHYLSSDTMNNCSRITFIGFSASKCSIYIEP
jgi:hypothetical protein